MESTTSPRRYANGILTRNRLLDAASELFANAGFRAVSLRDIAAEAGVSHAGLLRHFASKEAILTCLIDRFDNVNEHWEAERTHATEHPTATDVLDIAARNLRVPGAVELLTSLAGEATGPQHPAHDYMRERYRRARAATALAVPDAMPTAPESTTSTATRFLALWDGLHIQHLYDPEAVDVVEGLADHLGATPPQRRRAPSSPRSTTRAGDLNALPRDAGYAATQERRASIVDGAVILFARQGFHNTSLAAIAEYAGVPKSSLLRYFPTKEHLLTAVLVARDDHGLASARAQSWSAREHFAKIIESARTAVEAEPGLIAFFTVLTGEALAPEHPGHDYIRFRYRRARSYFTALFAEAADEGLLAPGRDPAREATNFLAMWDGLQIQWLYDPEDINIPGALSAHLHTVFTLRALPAQPERDEQ